MQILRHGLICGIFVLSLFGGCANNVSTLDRQNTVTEKAEPQRGPYSYGESYAVEKRGSFAKRDIHGETEGSQIDKEAQKM